MGADELDHMNTCRNHSEQKTANKYCVINTATLWEEEPIKRKVTLEGNLVLNLLFIFTGLEVREYNIARRVWPVVVSSAVQKFNIHVRTVIPSFERQLVGI